MSRKSRRPRRIRRRGGAMRKQEKPKRRNPWVKAMIARHPRTQNMRDRRQRRAKDARKHWSKEWE